MSVKKQLYTDLIIKNSRAKNKEELLSEIVSLAKRNPLLKNYSNDKILSELKTREDLESTGFIKNVAVPHCSLDEMDDFVTGLVIAPNGLDFNSADGEKTKIFFFIIGPKSKRNTHIRILSAISRFFKKPDVTDTLLNIKTEEEIKLFLEKSITYTEEGKTREKCLFQIILLKEKLLNDVLEVLRSTVSGRISIIEGKNAAQYLPAVNIAGGEDSYCKLIITVVNKSLCNDLIRKINMISEVEDNQDILIAIQDLFYTSDTEIMQANELKKKLFEGLNTAVYVDYENIYKQLEKYNKNPLEIDFFNKLFEMLQENKFNIRKFIVFTNFDQKEFRETRHQTLIQSWGIETRHTSNYGKNSADLELTVDAMKTLYTDDNIEVFVLISCDRDLIPLIKAIKSKNKIAFVISAEKGTHSIVKTYSDYYILIDDLFGLSKENISGEPGYFSEKNEMDISDLDIEKAKELCKLFYSSNRWEEYKTKKIAITVVGYVKQLIKKMNLLESEIYRIIGIANALGYISVVEKNVEGRVIECIEQGGNMNEINL
jgi:mannitol/fructose-specific phosphotransferase system IIA component (Ntr-type)/uncharacterized LabA/DUF88 family protein